MFLRQRKFILLLIVVIGLLAAAIPVFAQPPDLNLGLEYARATGLVDTDIRIIVARIINVALGLLGVVALAWVLYGGYEYMTAGGNEEQIAKAKKILLNAAIGLAIILSAYAITRFVISKLTDAIVGNYCIEHPADCQPVTPPCGPGECQPPVQTLFYATSTPQGQLAIKNVTVSVLFFGNFGFPANYDSQTVPPTAPENIKVVKKDGKIAAPGNFSLVSTSRIDFNPTGSCLDPDHPDNPAYSDSSNNCFEKKTTYQVILTTAIKSTGDRFLDCSVDYPCVGEFTTGELFDKEKPLISMILPGNGARLPVSTNIEISANYRDDGGVKMVTFNRDETKIKDIVLNPPQSEGTTSTLWFTGITAPTTYALTAVAADVDNHETTSTAQIVKVLPAHCFNGEQDGDETGVDCGPTCGACPGGTCNSSLDCAGGYCESGFCVVRPKITNVDPKDGAPGNYVTIFGKDFGNTPGQVIFHGGAGVDDDKTVSSFSCNGATTWHDNYIVVEVPTDARPGPIEMATSSTAGPLGRDATNDNWGPDFAETVFIVNDISQPGLCGVNPAEQSPNQYVQAAGTNLGSSGVLRFGTTSAEEVGIIWTNTLLSNVLVPNLEAQDLTVQAVVEGKESNPIPFKVLPAAAFTGPHIVDIEPKFGPPGSYVTIFGDNFGSSVGRVTFVKDGKIKDGLQPSDDCSNYWTPTQIVIKVPDSEAEIEIIEELKSVDIWEEKLAKVEVEEEVKTAEVKVLKAELAMVEGAVSVISEGVSSDNFEIFEITSGAAPPGLCLIEPNNGPEGVAVTLKGEGFGANYGKVEYRQNVTSTFSAPLAFPRAWSSDSIVDKIPVGAQSGKVKVWADRNGGLYSNGLNFTVQNCQTDTTVICPAGTTCCGSGSCAATCAVGPKSSVYAWSFSTGKLPVVPRVVEQCGQFCTESRVVCNKDVDCKGGATDKCLPVTPSPAPWSPHWSGHDNVCVNANVTLRFNTPINNDGVALTGVNIRDLIFVYACPDSACKLENASQLLSGDYSFGTWQSSNDKIVFAPKIAFPANGAPPPADAIATSTSYQVIVTTKVKSDQGNLSANMPANPNCPDISQIKTGQQAAYCFKFKTRTTKDYCELGSIVIDPVTYTTSTLGKPTITTTDFYNLTPLARQDLCLGLNGNDYDWSWSPPESDKNKESVYAWVSNKDILPKDMVDGNVDPVQDLIIKDKQTLPGQPQLISAYWTADKQSPKITGKAYLYISPQKPKVMDYWPRCAEGGLACINAEIGARFNMALATPAAGAAQLCQLSGDATSACETTLNISLSLGDTSDTLIIDLVPAGNLTPDKYYRVILKGGLDGIKSSNRLEIDKTSLNYNCTGAGDQKVCQHFSWTFKTNEDVNACEINRVEMRPTAATVYWIGQTQPFQARPFSAPDTCSDQGQRLRATDYNWAWSTAVVPPATLNATVTDDLDLAPATSECSANCLSLPLKDTPKSFCLRENLTENCCGSEKVDSDNNEECELGEPGCDGKCQFAGSSYLYDPPSYCGDGIRGIGEACEPDSIKDNNIDPLQYATAVSPVSPLVGKNQYQTQIFAATTNPKTKEEKKGQADFILQCGYSPVNTNCPAASNFDKGVGANSCCYPRPRVAFVQPSVYTDVCPNTAIVLDFDQVMDPASLVSSTLGYYNIILAEATSTASCPLGQYRVATEEIKPVGFWQKAMAFVRHLFGRPARADTIYCYGGINYSLETRAIQEYKMGTLFQTRVSLILKEPLAGEKYYKVIVAKPWVKSLAGVSLASERNFSFQTRNDICKIDKIEIDPVAWWFRTMKNEADDDPSASDAFDTMFDTMNDVDKVFTAHAYIKKINESALEQELQSMPGYSWTYNWKVDDDTIVKKVDDPNHPLPDSAAKIVAQNKNGVTQVGAAALITADSSAESTVGQVFSASSMVQVFICENPWPPPSVDINELKYGLGYVDAVDNSNGINIGWGWTNFKLMYCRDYGHSEDFCLAGPKAGQTCKIDADCGDDQTCAPSTADDLPELNSPTVITHTRSTQGTPCTSGSDCTFGYCYVDADGDGYAPSSGTKKCQDNSQLAGTDCNDANVSIYPGTSGGSTCSICKSDGTITYQALDQDLFGQCDTTGCYTGNCSGNSFTCGYYTSGQGNCSACQTCQGATSGSCVNMATYNDSEGSNTCAGTCTAYCSSGSCISTNTGVGTCTVATDVRVASGGTGHCASGDCVADAWAACGDSITFTYKGSSVTYGTVEHNSKCWLDRNLGASQVATAFNDANAYGDLFQWGRLSDLHQNRNSGITTSLSGSDNPGHSNFIYGMGSPYDWRSSQNNTLWQGVSGTNNPCPSGWRLPTLAEWDTERASWGLSQQNYNGAYASPLKLTAGGYRGYTTASLYNVGSYGGNWSSTVSGTNARNLYFYGTGAYMSSPYRAYGFSVRCLKDTAAPDVSPPTVTTNSASSVISNSAVLIGNVTATGGATVTTRGFQYGLSQTPTWTVSQSGSYGTGAYSLSATGLSSNTSYYFRAYATNTAGTGYGSWGSFTTSAAAVNVPSVTTNSASSVISNSAVLIGNVTATGGATVTTRGFQYGLSQTPTWTVSQSGSYGTGAYSLSATGLSSNTSYYFRAYATNSAGTGYGSWGSFTTSAATSNTNWGAGGDECSGSDKRLYGGSCITCGGWMNAGYCWYNAGSGQSCTTACSTHGGVYNGTCDWVNDPTDCSTCQHWYGTGATCHGTHEVGPVYSQPLSYCYYNRDGENRCEYELCDPCSRQCACNK